MNNEVDLAWAAGFLDGEGSILFRNSSKGRGGIVGISATQVDIRPLEKLITILGGKIYGPYGRKDKGIYKRKKHSPFYQWLVLGKKGNVPEICEKLYPYMTLKKDQIDVALQKYAAVVALNLGTGGRTNVKYD
jgi:hypothetical protein